MRARVRLTREGLALLVLTLGFTLGALNTGTNLLYFVTALAVNLYGLSLLVSWSALRGLVVTRRAPSRVVQQEPFEVELEVRHASGRGRAFPVEVRERPPRQAVARRPRALLLGLGAGQRAVLRYRTACLTRGWQAWRGVELSCRAPFGLVECRLRLRLPWRVLVLPAIHPVRTESLRREAPRAEAVARRLVFTQERRDVFRLLREHRPGDDLRAIHWRATARRGEPVVREFERTSPDTTLVLLDLASGDEAAVEAAVTLAASLYAQLSRRGERVALAALGEGPPLVLDPGRGAPSVRRAREALAVLRPGESPDLRQLAHRARTLSASAETVLVSSRGQARARQVARESFPQARLICLETGADLWRYCQRAAPAEGAADPNAA